MTHELYLDGLCLARLPVTIIWFMGLLGASMIYLMLSEAAM